MGYIVIKSKKDKKITINNKFSYFFLISDSIYKKLPVEQLFDVIEKNGTETDIEEIKKLSFGFSRN
ncbi:hypothetical protein [Thermodesulfovibrio sp. TK110]